MHSRTHIAIRRSLKTAKARILKPLVEVKVSILQRQLVELNSQNGFPEVLQACLLSSVWPRDPGDFLIAAVMLRALVL